MSNVSKAQKRQKKTQAGGEGVNLLAKPKQLLLNLKRIYYSSLIIIKGSKNNFKLNIMV